MNIIWGYMHVGQRQEMHFKHQNISNTALLFSRIHNLQIIVV